MSGLFPRLRGPGQRAEAGMHLRGEPRPGTEEFWIVWSASPVPELEDTVRAVSNPEQMGIIHDTARIGAIDSLLAKFQTTPPKSFVNQDLNQTTVRSSAEVLVSDVKIEHR